MAVSLSPPCCGYREMDDWWFCDSVCRSSAPARAALTNGSQLSQVQLLFKLTLHIALAFSFLALFPLLWTCDKEVTDRVGYDKPRAAIDHVRSQDLFVTTPISRGKTWLWSREVFFFFLCFLFFSWEHQISRIRQALPKASFLEKKRIVLALTSNCTLSRVGPRVQMDVNSSGWIFNWPDASQLQARCCRAARVRVKSPPQPAGKGARMWTGHICLVQTTC